MDLEFSCSMNLLRFFKVSYINIRYLEGNIYYYIKLAEIKDAARGDYYRIMCAYPVFRENTKRELNRMFGKVKRN